MPQREELKFVKKFLFYFFPLLIFIAVPFFFLVIAGELVPIKMIIHEQKDQTKLILFGLAYLNPDKYYKMHSVLERNPTVIALGNSRVMQFRSKFFRKGVRFFNAGGAVESMTNFKHFLNMIPKGQEPKLIILGLDQRFFNSRYEADYTGYDIDSQLSNLPNYFETVRSGYLLYSDYFRKKFKLEDLFNHQRNNQFGFNAIVKHKGFRNDGSYYEGDIIENPNSPQTRHRFDDVLRRISGGTDLFEYSSEYSRDSVAELREFLKECSLRNIHVVGFLPPFPHLVYEKMRRMGDKYAYMFQLDSVLPGVFREFDFNFLDFSDIASFGASDEETLDGFHGSEKAYLRLFIVMAQQDKNLGSYADDAGYLRMKLRDSKSSFNVFANNEF